MPTAAMKESTEITIACTFINLAQTKGLQVESCGKLSPWDNIFIAHLIEDKQDIEKRVHGLIRWKLIFWVNDLFVNDI